MATKSLFVGNLSYNTSEGSLRSAFQDYDCSSVRVVEGRGFGFVDVNADRADEAIEAMNDRDLDGRTITVNVARPREAGGGGGNSGGGRRY